MYQNADRFWTLPHILGNLEGSTIDIRVICVKLMLPETPHCDMITQEVQVFIGPLLVMCWRLGMGWKSNSKNDVLSFVR